MVLTRRQSQNLSQHADDLEGSTRKRANGEKEDQSPRSLRSPKRRKVDPLNKSTLTVLEVGDSLHADLPLRAKEFGEAPTSGVTTQENEEEIEGVAESTLDKHELPEHGTDNLKAPEPFSSTLPPPVALNPIEQLRKDKKQKSRARDEREKDTATGAGTEATSTKRSHIRFGSEEPGAPVGEDKRLNASHETQQTPSAEAIDSLSDDDAPEEHTLADGQHKAIAARQDAARATQQQSAVAREKRRAREAQLKEQALSGKKRKRGRQDILAGNNEIGSLGESDTHRPAIHRSNLPALLPDHILAAEPILGIDLPTANDERPKKSQKHKFFLPEDERPKDVSLGAVKVRVLEKSNAHLAPKASKASQSIKESWLAGRQGRRGGSTFERRAAFTSFVRR